MICNTKSYWDGANWPKNMTKLWKEIFGKTGHESNERNGRITLLKRSSLRMSILACREPSWDYYGVFGYRWGPEAPLVRFPNSYSWNVTIRHQTFPCFAFLLDALTECNEKHNVDFKIYASISQHIISILNGWLPHTWHVWYLTHKIVTPDKLYEIQSILQVHHVCIWDVRLCLEFCVWCPFPTKLHTYWQRDTPHFAIL